MPTIIITLQNAYLFRSQLGNGFETFYNLYLDKNMQLFNVR